jgi:cell wall-associated NlpC family hydrolase
MALSLILLATVTSSCHSHKPVVQDNKYDNHGKYSGDDEQIFGFKINGSDNKDLYKEIKTWLGSPYVYGGNTRAGVDCSGMVLQIYLKVYGIKLQRNAAAIFNDNCVIIGKDDLREGDLVFFSSPGSKRITHVGIYLKENKFVHASASKGVVISDITQPYYIRFFAAAGRVKQLC